MINSITANRLAGETSPYLLQHKNNPVNWYPWGDEAFEAAQNEAKPIFLSSGYSACHWCHVMEHEVFEDRRAAELLNRHFISVKLDREERPDIDHLYMECCMALTGSGGWPLTVFMTPEKRPFFAGTYFPVEQFVKLTQNIAELWRDDRQRLENASGSIFPAISPERQTSGVWREDLPHMAFRQLRDSFDAVNGGFGHAPKFPSPHTLMFLQRYALRYGNSAAGEMARHTLERMALGGIFDHIGGGFCRYSTDEYYLAPHFEKMLYDNAMLALAYAESGYADTTNRILEFCFRELGGPNGAYYTALDADSEGQEGKYYLFTTRDVQTALGTDAGRYSKLYGVTEDGNHEGRSIPNLLQTGRLSPKDEGFAESCRARLLEYRSGRVPPFRDEKLLLSSNSLMLAALATCGRRRRNAEYIEKAVTLAGFILGNMRRGERFYASYSMGALGTHPATSDDYAYLAWALYRLHQATLDDKWLTVCEEICGQMLALFADEDGLLWLSGADVRDLPMRVKNTQDGALPCGNSIAAGVFQRLYILLGDEKYHRAYQKILAAMSHVVERSPTAYTSLLSAAMLSQNGLKVELPYGDAPMHSVSEGFYPFAAFKAGPNTGAMVCTGSACLPPVQDAEKLAELLSGLAVEGRTAGNGASVRGMGDFAI
ncbi:thioredoxin domain-containing protein [Clostridia bacterium]|nr:thioredoxin domain-containing protein [Clostridia bacterium]